MVLLLQFLLYLDGLRRRRILLYASEHNHIDLQTGLLLSALSPGSHTSFAIPEV